MESQNAGKTHEDKVLPELHDEIIGATCPVCPNHQPPAACGCPWESSEITVALSLKEARNGTFKAQDEVHYAALDA